MQDAGRYREAADLYREGLAVARALVADYPPRREHPFYERNVTSNLRGLSALHQRRGENVEAEKAYRESAALTEELAGRHPREHDLAADVVIDKVRLANFLQDMGRRTEAEKLYREAQDRRALAADHPQVMSYRSCEPNLCLTLGELHHAAGRRAEAESEFRLAVRSARNWSRTFPTRWRDTSVWSGC